MAGGKRWLQLGLDLLRFSQRWDLASHRFSAGSSSSGQGENLGLVTENNFYTNKDSLTETELFRFCFILHLPFRVEAGGSGERVPIAYALL